MEHEIKFGTLNQDGTESNVRMIKQSDIGKCPFYIFMPEHYREDGTCKCNDAEHRKMMIKEWGYTKRDFKNIPLAEERQMKQVKGYYNAQEYYIKIDGEEVYRAGNSPYESQTFVRAKDGVGLRKMRSYCILTTHDIAKEKHAKYAGVERIMDYEEDY